MWTNPNNAHLRYCHHIGFLLALGDVIIYRTLITTACSARKIKTYKYHELKLIDKVKCMKLKQVITTKCLQLRVIIGSNSTDQLM